MKFTKEENKKLIKRYPFLQPRNVWTDKIPEDYDYDHIRGGTHELPDGWVGLFLQMCEDIREPLIKANYLDKFRFTQIKEKFNHMRCYNNGASEEVLEIIQKYEVMSRYICTKCGKPAVYETSGYIESYCVDCWKDISRHEEGEFIECKTSYKVEGYKNGEHYEKNVSFEDEWNRYIKSLDDTEKCPLKKIFNNNCQHLCIDYCIGRKDGTRCMIPSLDNISSKTFSREDFIEKYCHNCGTQRCEGIDSEWFESCKKKKFLRKE